MKVDLVWKALCVPLPWLVKCKYRSVQSFRLHHHHQYSFNAFIQKSASKNNMVPLSTVRSLNKKCRVYKKKYKLNPLQKVVTYAMTYKIMFKKSCGN